MPSDESGLSISTEWDDHEYSTSVESHDLPGLDVDVSVSLPDDIETSESQIPVIETYAENIETFVRKNTDYSGSYENGPKIESVIRHGEVRESELPQLLAEQIFVRGFLDKLSRFYHVYIESNDPAVDESATDSLLDMANYAIMLATKLREYDADREVDQ